MKAFIVIGLLLIGFFATLSILQYFNANFRTMYLAKESSRPDEYYNMTGNPQYNLTSEDLEKWPILLKAINEIEDNNLQHISYTISSDDANEMTYYFYENCGETLYFQYNGAFYSIMFPLAD